MVATVGHLLGGAPSPHLWGRVPPWEGSFTPEHQAHAPLVTGRPGSKPAASQARVAARHHLLVLLLLPQSRLVLILLTRWPLGARGGVSCPAGSLLLS